MRINIRLVNISERGKSELLNLKRPLLDVIRYMYIQKHKFPRVFLKSALNE